MKLLIPTILLFILASCNQASDKYYISKDFNYFTDHYILAEKKADSLHLWHLSNNINSGFYLTSAETLPFNIMSGGKFKIENITNNYIVVNGKTLRRVYNLKNYYKLRNEITAMPIESEYEDSVRSILNMVTTSIALLPVHDETKVKLVSTTHCDSFAKKYREYMHSQLPTLRADVASKKELYSRMLAGQVSPDSASFKNFIEKYRHGYYDRKLFYQFIIRNPDLFFLEIDLFGVKLDVNCGECFTKEERVEMYCKLEPLSYKDPWKVKDMFYRELGDLKCGEYGK